MTSSLPHSPIRSLWLASLVASTLGVVGCGDGSVSSEDSAIELTKVDPSTLLNARYAAPYYPSMLEADLDPLQISYPVALTQSFSEDTSKGDCFLNHAEVGSGVRLGGTFKIDQTIKISGWSVDFSPSDRARNPFLVEISFNLGDVKLVSQGDVDISVPCLGLDQKLTVKLNGVRATVVLGAPSTTRPSFHYESTAITIDSFTVDGEPGLLDWAVAELLEAQLNKDSNRHSVETALVSAIGSSFEELATLADLFFFGDMGVGKAIHALNYYDASAGMSSKCASAPCALYSVY